MESKKKRPIGILLLSIIYYIAVPFSLIISGIIFLSPTLLENIPEFDIPAGSLILYSMGVFMILFAVLCFFLARELLRGKKIARKILIIISIINIVGGIFSVILRSANLSYIGIGFNTIVLLYLVTSKKVKNFFTE